MTSAPQTKNAYIDLPDGFDAPGLPILLDTAAMLERLNQFVPSGGNRFTGCKITNLRRKTSTTCTICYELTRMINDVSTLQYAYVRAFSRFEYDDSLRRAGLTQWADTDDNLSISPLLELFAIVYWFPNDERLVGLRRVMIPKKLQRLFYEYFTDYDPDTWRVSDRSLRLQIVRYKPERRAVLRCRFRAQRKDDSIRQERFVYLGLYERERLAELAIATQRVRELSTGSRCWKAACLIGIVEDDSLVIWDELSGKSLRELLGGSDSESSIDSCARAIAELHSGDGAGLPSRQDVSTQLSDVGSYLLSVLPECRDLITSLVGRLLESRIVCAREPHSVVHGDLHPGQLIIGNGPVGIVDFDRIHSGNPIEDIGNFRTQLLLGPREGLNYDPDRVFDRFVDGYSRAGKADIDLRVVAEWTAATLFRSAIVPLGRFESNWRSRSGSILRMAASYLS